MSDPSATAAPMTSTTTGGGVVPDQAAPHARHHIHRSAAAWARVIARATPPEPDPMSDTGNQNEDNVGG